MQIQTHMLDALPGYGHDVLEISFMLHLESYSRVTRKSPSFFF